jgi:hypothetical protein
MSNCSLKVVAGQDGKGLSKMTNLDKMNVLPTSATAELVGQIEAAAAAKGLTVSRWQTVGGSTRLTITWAIHRGERVAQLAQQDNIIGDKVILTAMEGSTTRSTAYRALSKLLEVVNNV